MKALVLATLLAPPAASAFALFPWASSDADNDDESRVARLLTCLWRGSFERGGHSSPAPSAHDLSGRLEGEQNVRSYPAFPHAPVLVAAATCDRVELRWKSFEDAAWPVRRFVLQRFPDMQHRGEWETLLDTASEPPPAVAFADARVRAGERYSYRVQAVSAVGNVSSAFAVQQVVVAADSAACSGSSSSALFGLLPSTASTPLRLLSPWSCDAVRTLGLLVLCFLSVFALLRAYAKRAQGARARSCRLKRIHKSASENVRAVGTAGVASAPSHTQRPHKLTERSSSDSSTSPPSEPPADLQHTSQRSMASLASPSCDGADDDCHPRESSFSVAGDSGRASDARASVCQNCHKRFGLFRRRHPCDICHAVTLCRRCGYQAPAGFTRSSVSAMDEALGAGRRSSAAASGGPTDNNAKIKTICRRCCEEVYRYSTSARPRGSRHGRRRDES